MKSGFVAIIGRSNVGKSTLLNTLVGTKLAATSFRAQMTRHVIHGVLNRPEGQAVFIDTPGIFQDSKKNLLSAKLYNRAKEALHGVDVIIYLVDPSKSIGPEERSAFGLIRKLDTPKILVINKMDLPKSEQQYLADYYLWAKEFSSVLEISALEGSHVEPLRQKVLDLLPEGETLYTEGQATNITHHFWIAEIIREKVFSVLDKEVPYAATVEVDEVVEREKDQMLMITARVLVSDARYKKIIIGHSAHKIKEIGTMARRELEAATNHKVFLDLNVEVDHHWVERI